MVKKIIVDLRKQLYETPASSPVEHMGLRLAELFGYTPDGFFVDVGGFNGLTQSLTWGLAKAGWKGLIIEPVPEYVESAKLNHREHNVEVIEGFVGQGKQGLELSVESHKTSAKPKKQDVEGERKPVKTREHKIKVKPALLSSILKKAKVDREFDFLTVSTNGTELEALETLGFDKYQPKVIAVNMETDGEQIEHLLLANDYVRTFFDGRYGIFVHKNS